MATFDAGTTPVLLYDGECGFCAGSVQFVLGRESSAHRTQLRFAPLQGTFGTAALQAHPALAGVDSVVWYTPGAPGSERVLVRSAAALALLRHLGGVWRWLALLARLVPTPLLDAVYNQIARRRFELAAPACLLPTPDQRARFLS